MRFITRNRLLWLTRRRTSRPLPPQGRNTQRVEAVQCSIQVKAPAWLSPNQPGMGRPTAPVRKQRSLTGIRMRRFAG